MAAQVDGNNAMPTFKVCDLRSKSGVVEAEPVNE
jgi:hypothetical protein